MKTHKDLTSKIFVILSGEYEDWRIEGYTQTEKEAILICAEHNDTELDDYQDDWYYFDISKIATPKGKKAYVGYVFGVFLSRDKAQYSFENQCEPKYTQTYTESAIVRIADYRRNPFNVATITVQVPCSSDSETRALKIAQDKWYEYLAKNDDVQKRMADIVETERRKLVNQAEKKILLEFIALSPGDYVLGRFSNYVLPMKFDGICGGVVTAHTQNYHYSFKLRVDPCETYPYETVRFVYNGDDKDFEGSCCTVPTLEELSQFNLPLRAIPV